MPHVCVKYMYNLQNTFLFNWALCPIYTLAASEAGFPIITEKSVTIDVAFNSLSEKVMAE